MNKAEKVKPQDDAHSTLLRSVRVLFGLVEAGRPTSVGQLARTLELPPSTTHRILNVLKEAGYVAQHEETGSYAPGLAFLRVSAMMAVSTTFQTFVEATLADLGQRGGESAFYAAYLKETQRLRFVKILHSHHAIQYVLRADQTYSLLWGASGHAIACKLPEDVVRATYEREKDSAEGAAVLPSWKSLVGHLRRVQRDGHAVSHGQRHEGSHAIAAPVVDRKGCPVGCVGIAMPSSRHQPEKMAALIELVMAAGAQLSSALGVMQPPGTVSS